MHSLDGVAILLMGVKLGLGEVLVEGDLVLERRHLRRVLASAVTQFVGVAGSGQFAAILANFKHGRPVQSVRLAAQLGPFEGAAFPLHLVCHLHVSRLGEADTRRPEGLVILTELVLILDVELRRLLLGLLAPEAVVLGRLVGIRIRLSRLSADHWHQIRRSLGVASLGRRLGHRLAHPLLLLSNTADSHCLPRWLQTTSIVAGLLLHVYVERG